MNYIKLVRGNFFFAGSICLTGNGSEIYVDGNDLDVNTIKLINISQASEIIETDIPKYEEKKENIFNESEIVVETTTQVELETVVENKPKEENKDGAEPVVENLKPTGKKTKKV